MDNEFNKVTDHVPNVILNTPAASEHVSRAQDSSHQGALPRYPLHPTLHPFPANQACTSTPSCRHVVE